MSFFGGGTDMESFFMEHGGAVLSTTFDKYCYVNVRHLPRFFDYSTELSYAKTERVTNIEDIQHPAIRNAMKMLDMHEIRLTYEADLPARSGLGTSSSFAVGMLNAFYALKGKYADKKKLADEAIFLERNLCQEAGGWQDQIAASFGGFNRINFNANGYEVLPVIISPERKKQLNQNLMMFFTGFTRFSSDVQKANASGKVDKTAQLKEMLSLVGEAEKVLTDKAKDIDDFGRLLAYTWELKRQTGTAISTNCIDQLYAKGIAAGALGGKLLGAGGGGFLVFYVQPERQEAVRLAMRDLLYIPFKFEDAIGSDGKIKVGLNASSLLVKNKTESTETKFKLKTNYDQYLRELLQLLTANKKYEIYIIPHVERDAGDELKKEFPNLHYLEPFDNPISAKSFISQMDIFIGARMHATIGAFSAGVATIPTAYSRKFKGLYESLGYKYVVDLAELNTHEAVELTVEYVKRYKELKLDVERCSINAEQRTALTYRILYEQLKEILA